MFRTIMVVAAALAGGSAAFAADAVPKPVVPVIAPQPPSVQGYLGARYGGLWGDGSRLIDEKTAAANMPFRHGYLELEARAAAFFMSGPATVVGMGVGHFYRRNSDGAYGLFGGWDVFPGEGLALGGLEVQHTYGRVIPYVQAAYAPAVGGGTDTWWARAGVKYFPSDNFKLQGDIRDVQGAFDGWLVSGDAEWRKAGRPWSAHVTLNYQTGAGAFGGAATSFLAGINLHIGNATLYQAYTTGAIWDILPTRF